jgi:hypothetical protein
MYNVAWLYSGGAWGAAAGDIPAAGIHSSIVTDNTVRWWLTGYDDYTYFR